jgi:hypothetical protein
MFELDYIDWAIIVFCVVGVIILEVAISRSRKWGENPKLF